MSSKECRDCGQVKPATEFWKRKASPDGLSLYCKECFGLRNAACYRGKQAKQGKKTRPYRRHSAVPEEMKYCPQCEEIKALAEFGRNRANASGLADYCKPCHNAVMAEGKRRNHGSQRGYLLKLRYGLTEEQVGQMAAQQGGICVICLRGAAKHVDHDHMTGLVRRLLCFKCNGALGQFEDDSRRLRDAADYLELRGPHARRMELEFDATVIGGPARCLTDVEWRTRAKSLGSARHYHLRQKYGINDEDARELLRVQGGLCAICCDRPAEHVDHDHETGAVRGMLCVGCNSGMGQLGDDPVALRRAADYVLGSLVRTVSTNGGGTRLSFTYLDVDPATVPLNGWESYRERDGEHRKGVLELEAELEPFPWLEIIFGGAYSGSG